MISTGSEGKYGCESDMALVELIHSYPEIDYINIHIWPTNWGWSSRINPNEEDLERSISKSRDYIEEHLPIAERLGKPIIIEEFGYPRDGYSFSMESTTEHRDAYYGFIFEQVEQSRLRRSHCGCISGAGQALRNLLWVTPTGGRGSIRQTPRRSRRVRFGISR